MKNLIIYKSNTGFTKEYAEILQRRIGGDLVEVKRLKKKMLIEADNIFYGGPIRNNVIESLNKFLKYYDYIEDKNIFIFAVGIQPATEDKKDNVITANGLDLYHVRLYLLNGGMDITRMSKFKQKLMLYGSKLAAKKEGISADVVESRLKTPINMVNSDNLDRMIEVYRKVNIKL